MTQKFYNRTVIKKYDFKVPGTFQSFYAAELWAKENGYSYGSMDGRNPIAMRKDESYISKWHNLSKEEQDTCDAAMIGEFREGEVTILIFK